MLWPWLPVVLVSSGDSPDFLIRSLDLLLDLLGLEILYQSPTLLTFSSSDFSMFWKSLQTSLLLLHSFSKFWLSLYNCWKGHVLSEAYILNHVYNFWLSWCSCWRSNFWLRWAKLATSDRFYLELVQKFWSADFFLKHSFFRETLQVLRIWFFSR